MGGLPRRPVGQHRHPVGVVDGARLNAGAGLRVGIAVDQPLAIHVGAAPQGEAQRALQDRLGKAGGHVDAQRLGGQGGVLRLGRVVVAVGHIYPPLLTIGEGVGSVVVLDPGHGPALHRELLVALPAGAHGDPGIGRLGQGGAAVRHEMQGAGGVVDGPQLIAAGIAQLAEPVILQGDDGIAGLDHQLLIVHIKGVIERVELHPQTAGGEVVGSSAVQAVQRDGEVPHHAGRTQAARLDMMLGHRLTILVLGHVLLTQGGQGDVLQINDALGIVDDAGNVAPDLAIPHRVVGGLAHPPGQD
ncbi:hypothetical protein D3C71_805740 [compost metagenome]